MTINSEPYGFYSVNSEKLKFIKKQKVKIRPRRGRRIRLTPYLATSIPSVGYILWYIIHNYHFEVSVALEVKLLFALKDILNGGW